MKSRKGLNHNHPKKGACIRVNPIRELEGIQLIKRNLDRQHRNLCLFTLGINTAYRANELLSLTVGQVAKLRTGDMLGLKQSKTGDFRAIVVNGVTVKAIQEWLYYHPKSHEADAPLFVSGRRKHKPLTVAAVNHLVKRWSKDAGLNGNYGSHTLRKTWGYHQRMTNHASVALLMKAFGHATETQTLQYLGILPQEVHDLYRTMEL